jgi:hypothetical protein
VLAAPLAGQAIGAINGVLAAYARLPSFLITLGMLFAVNGMTLYLTQVTAIGVEPDLQIQSVFNGFLFGAPTIALWALTAWLLSVSAEYQAALARPHIVGGDTIDLPECEDARKVIRMLSQQSSRRLSYSIYRAPSCCTCQALAHSRWEMLQRFAVCPSTYNLRNPRSLVVERRFARQTPHDEPKKG